MTLPVINTPSYNLNVPSTDQEITYRPFLVKEDNLLLIAQETGDDKYFVIAYHLAAIIQSETGRQLTGCTTPLAW